MTSRMDATRREALKTVAVGATGLAAATVAIGKASAPTRAKDASRNSAAPTNPDVARAEAVRAFLGDIVAGAQLGAYTVVRIDPMDRGGIPITMSGPSGEFGVDVLRHDPTDDARGVGSASAVSVFVRNGGNGKTATEEAAGLGAMALAAALDARVRAGATPPVDMRTMAERASAASIA